MKILRLLLTEQCNRSCSGCCNKDWDLAGLEIETDFTGYDQILLTGGEPMLDPDAVIDMVAKIRKQTASPIIMYTADVRDIDATMRVISMIDGITVTLHDQCDVEPFLAFHERLMETKFFWGKTLRVNVFRGVEFTNPSYRTSQDMQAWHAKKDIVWVKDCPLPENETFKRATAP